METYSLAKLNEYIRRVIALNFVEYVWISCELVSIKESRGHYYLDLAEKEETTDDIIAQSSAVIWRAQWLSINRNSAISPLEILKPGNAVRLRVQVEYHAKFGLKLVIFDIDASYTLGKIFQNRLEILKLLAAEKLLDKNKHINLPVVLKRIAVITSPTAAGKEDFENQLLENMYGYQFDLQYFYCAMQGPKVLADITQAIKTIQKGKYDSVVIIRGGGSKLDLMDFDHYEIGKAICKSKIAVLTGIGHQIDESVADICAHTKLKTPTAVAEFLIQHNVNFENLILEQYHAIAVEAESQVREMKQSIQLQLRQLQYASNHSIFRMRGSLEFALSQVRVHSTSILQKRQAKLEYMDALNTAQDPNKILERGYSISLVDGKVIKNTKQLKIGSELTTQLSKGNISSKITSTHG